MVPFLCLQKVAQARDQAWPEHPLEGQGLHNLALIQARSPWWLLEVLDNLLFSFLVTYFTFLTNQVHQRASHVAIIRSSWYKQRRHWCSCFGKLFDSIYSKWTWDLSFMCRDPVVPHQGIHSAGKYLCLYQKPCSRMFLETLFVKSPKLEITQKSINNKMNK